VRAVGTRVVLARKDKSIMLKDEDIYKNDLV